MIRLCLLLVLAMPAASPAAEKVVAYGGEVKAVLTKRCVGCHNTARPRGDLDLSNFAGVKAGGVSGPAAVAGKPEQSLIYTMAAHLEEPAMPPNAPKIPAGELDALKAWIAGGLVEKPISTVVSTAAPGGLGTPTILARASPVTALAADPAGKLVAVAGVKQVLLFDAAAGKLSGALPFPEGEVQSLSFSRDGKRLLAAGGVGGQSGACVAFEVGSWRRAFAVGDEPDAVLAAALSPDTARVVFGGPSRVVKVAAVADGKVLHTFAKPTDWVTAVGFSPDGLLVAGADRFGGVFVWEAESGKEFLNLKGHTKAVTGIAFAGDELATASEDGTVRVWNLHSGETAAKWVAHAPGVAALAWTGDTIATAGRDKLVKIWSRGGQLKTEFGPLADVATEIALTSESVVSGDWSGRVRVWPLAGGAASELRLPVMPPAVHVAAVPVPLPDYPVEVQVVAKVDPKPAAPTKPSDLERKRAALKSVEDAVERLKTEAASAPDNAALAKAYLQLCEAALAVKADVIRAESAQPQAKP